MVPVLIDCDTCIDDALALMYLAALHHERVFELVGATITA
ncbi:MAG: nucleoside hydrolase, partial [Corynebacterium sp.]|nr:nucleoside hydrolase [Corynebacterium sp.]